MQDRLLEETIYRGWDTNGFTSDQHIIVSEYLLIFAALLCCSLLIQHFVGHVSKWQYLPETAATIMVGMAISFIIRVSGGYNDNNMNRSETAYFDPSSLGFSPELFFFGFLPPIVFNSGYHLKRRLLFDNFAGIFALAVLGTFISVAITATVIFLLGDQTKLLPSASSFTLIESIAFASLISLTDPVGTLAVFQSLRAEPALFNLVSGESILNNAISITIFKVTSRFIGHKMYSSEIFFCFMNFWISFIGSCFIGYSMGIMIALIYKYVDFRHHRLSAISLFVSTVYVPFFLAEVFQLSGVVTILVAGIASSQCINRNLPSNARQNASFVFQLIAYLAETSCFCLLGLSVFSQSFEYFRFDMIFMTLMLLVVSRAMHVYPLLSLLNYGRLRYGSYLRSEMYEVTKTNSIEEAEIEGKNPKNALDIGEKPPSTPSSKEITWAQVHTMMFSGLRSAVAFSLANIFPDTNSNKKLVIATTTAIIVVTIFFGGGLTTTVMKFFKKKTDVDDAVSDQELNDKKETFEKIVVDPFSLRGGHRSRIPTAKGCSSRGGFDFNSIENGPSEGKQTLSVENSLYIKKPILRGKKSKNNEEKVIVEKIIAPNIGDKKVALSVEQKYDQYRRQQSQSNKISKKVPNSQKE